MTIKALQAWREPLAGDWRERLAEVVTTLAADREADAGPLRRLAAMRLGDGERMWLRRALKGLRTHAEPPRGFRAFRLLLVSNRTLSFLAGDLEAAGAARGLMIEAVEADYDAVAALALDAAKLPPHGAFDAVLLLVDAEFFPASGDLADVEAERASLAGERERLEAIIAGLARKCRAPVLTATIPVAENHWTSADLAIAGTTARRLQFLNAAIVELAQERRTVVFDLACLAARIGGFAFFDPARFHLAKTPFSFGASPVVADALASLFAAMTGRAGRVLALDLDNTLWGGVVADDGVSGITLGQGSPEGEAFLDFQRRAAELRRRGVALAVCSKNLEEIAREPFRSHPDMLLRESDIAAFVANFDDKATNLARIARALDLDVSSIVFFDDNPAERERVRSSLPWAMVPEPGDDPAEFGRTLLASGYFEHLQITAEDTNRAAAYHARAEARTLRDSVSDYGEYLTSLGMEMVIAPFDAIGRARIAQLVQKSNQFNLTTKRYGEPDIEAIEHDAARIAWQIRLKDRFADHGLICVVIADKGAKQWRIDSWIMSCRVLERGVEIATMAELVARARHEGATALIGEYRPTARNALVRDFYPKLGFAPAPSDDPDGFVYVLDLANASFPQTMMSVVTAPKA